MVLDFKQIYSSSWDIFKKSWLNYVLVSIIMLAVLFIPVIGGILQFLVTILMINAVLKSVKGQDIKFFDFFAFKDILNAKVITIFVVISLYTLLVQTIDEPTTTLILSLAGFILTILFFPLISVMLDKKFDIKETLVYSYNLTKGARLDIILIIILNSVIGMVGLFLLFIGILVAVPVITISIVSVYQALDGKLNKFIDVAEVK